MIRRARPGDLAALMPLVRGLAAHHGDVSGATEASLFAHAFGPGAVVTLLVAEEREAGIIGYAALVPLIRLHLGQRGADLHHLFITEAHRGRGHARALVEAAKAETRRQGGSYLTVSATRENLAAQDYYRALGAKEAPVLGQRFVWDLSVSPRPAP